MLSVAVVTGASSICIISNKTMRIIRLIRAFAVREQNRLILQNVKA